MFWAASLSGSRLGSTRRKFGRSFNFPIQFLSSFPLIRDRRRGGEAYVTLLAFCALGQSAFGGSELGYGKPISDHHARAPAGADGDFGARGTGPQAYESDELPPDTSASASFPAPPGKGSPVS